MSEFVFETVARRAVEDGNREALVCGDNRLSYEEFEKASNQIARYLQSVGVVRGDRVAVAMEKSTDYVCSLFGIMKAGACYVPIDASYPPHRMGQIIDDCKIRVLIANGDVLGRLANGGTEAGAGAAAGLTHVLLADDSNAHAATGTDVTPLSKVRNQDGSAVSVSVLMTATSLTFSTPPVPRESLRGSCSPTAI